MGERKILKAGGVRLVPPRKASLLPFEKLPNLPKPKIPVIDLGIRRTDIAALTAAPSLSNQKRMGLFVSDEATQTDDTHIMEVKQVIQIIQTVLQDVAQLRTEFDFAQKVLRAEYESKLNHRAGELVNEKVEDIRKQYDEKVEIVRRSYRQQLNNAIQKIAGEYKAYYDELMSGKTGRHDLKIKELQERVREQEGMLEVQALKIEELMTRLGEVEDQGQEEAPPPPSPGISMEEAQQLRDTIETLETELTEVKARLAAKEDTERRLSQQLSTTAKELENEKGKVAQLKRDMEGLKKKSKAEQEKAARLAESQRASLERDMRERVEKAQKDATLEAQRDAEQRRLQDQAAIELERERNRRREEELLAQQSTSHPGLVDEGELQGEVARLQLLETKQKEEILRLQKELDRVNRVWSTKLAIMKKNFHALRDESFLRSSLQRQAAMLHHATLGYAVNAYHTTDSDSTDQNTTQTVSTTSRGDTRCLSMQGDRISVPPPPTPIQTTPRDTLSKDAHTGGSHRHTDSHKDTPTNPYNYTPVQS